MIDLYFEEPTRRYRPTQEDHAADGYSRAHAAR